MERLCALISLLGLKDSKLVAVSVVSEHELIEGLLNN